MDTATLKITNPLAAIEAKWPRLFMGMTHHKTTSGDRLTFTDKAWLEAIYKDNNDRMVIVKCAQVHMTEHFLCAMFTLARRGLRGMYILPTNEHRRPFVTDRINRQRDNSPLYRKAIKEAGPGGDSNVYKTIFGSGWKFVGANVRNNFFEFPADVLIMDEFDLLDQTNLDYAYDRLANSSEPYIYKFGNPTSENMGIHKEWLSSNQQEWFVMCHHCGTEQTLDWFEHFVEKSGPKYRLRNNRGKAICAACGNSFNRCGDGRWIAQNPASPISGYRVNRLFTYKSDTDIVGHIKDSLFAKFIEALGNMSKMQNFCNNYLGMPFDNYDLKLTETLLQAAAAQSVVTFEGDCRTIAGIDQGRLFTVVISAVVDGVIHDLSYDVCSTWDELTALLDAMNVTTAVIDAQGGGYAETRKFARNKEGRWMCYYRPKDQVRSDFKLEYEDSVVITNRTEILDTMIGQFKHDMIRIRPDWRTACEGAYFEEMQVPQRKLDTGGRAVWTKGTDHFFHASAYRSLALQVSGMTNSGAVQKEDWNIDRKPKAISVQSLFEKGVIGDIDDETKELIPAAISKKKKRKWHVG